MLKLNTKQIHLKGGEKIEKNCNGNYKHQNKSRNTRKSKKNSRNKKKKCNPNAETNSRGLYREVRIVVKCV